MKSASVKSIMKMKFKCFPFEGVWAENFGKPEIGGTWIIWGESAGGKSTFVMQLAKYLCNFSRVAYFPYEEGITSASLQRRLELCKMKEVDNRMSIYEPIPVEELIKELSDIRASVFIFDSLQAMSLRYSDYVKIRQLYPRKTLIFVSQAERGEPKRACAKAVKFDAAVKIFVKGYAATCMGRYMPAAGTCYVIWENGYKKQIK